MEILRVRQNTLENRADGNNRLARGNRRGELVIIDFWTQLFLDGRVFHMQAGYEDTPVDTCTTIDDQLAMMVVDNRVGWTMLPVYANCQLATYGTATVPPVAMLELDRSKNRYVSGGTAYVAENLRTDRPRTSIAVKSYIGPDITIAAKTAVPGSIELARRCAGETAPGDATENSDFMANFGTPLYSAMGSQQRAVLVGTGAIVLYWGCATTDGTGYATLDWAELPSESVT